MRMLMGLLAGRPFTATLVGDESLSRRPMRRVIEPLARMGGTDRIGRRPRADHGARRPTARNCLRAGDPERPGEERRPARRPSGERDDVGDRAGADARPHRARIRRLRGVRAVDGPDGRRSRAASASSRASSPIPGDFSSAAFWMVAAAALPGSRVVDRGCRPESDANRPGRRPAGATAPGSSIEQTSVRRRRTERNDHRRRGPRGFDRDCAGGSAGAD